MKQVEINAELRITYKMEDDTKMPSLEDFEKGLTLILQDELSDGSDNLKARVIIRGIDVFGI